ncbi:MAG: hypothetical protein IKB79_07055 [Oscillospiraceae bacterium]|nr:hypothetical protein [Oscillospiraceae bacterium]
MTSEFLLEAIGQMDDELVLEAAAPIKRHIPWRQGAGWAAAILLCVGIAHISGLPLNGASMGAAAPEAENAKGGLLADTADGAGDYEYRADQESQVEEPAEKYKSESMTAGGTAQGVMEPKFFTRRGVYLIVAPLNRTPPPEGAKELGKLVAAVPGTQAYPATGTQELVGCPVWESENGLYLYIQWPDGSWLTAKLYE